MLHNNDEIIRFFEDAGYSNVEIIGDRLLFTTGEDVINCSVQEAVDFMRVRGEVEEEED